MGATPSYFSIGKLVKLLEVDFPGISVSKVRYLESKGLVNPERSTSGYRRYSEKDLNQLRLLLENNFLHPQNFEFFYHHQRVFQRRFLDYLVRSKGSGQQSV